MDVMADQRRPRPYHERFGTEVGTDEAKRRLINRVANLVFVDFVEGFLRHSSGGAGALKNVAYRLGEEYSLPQPVIYVMKDFERCLQALEAMYEVLDGPAATQHLASMLSTRISKISRG
jgi:hypothetical protein